MLIDESDVEVILGRPLTDEEADRFPSLVIELTTQLEMWLNRVLEVREVVEYRTTAHAVNGGLLLNKGPVQAVHSVENAGNPEQVVAWQWPGDGDVIFLAGWSAPYYYSPEYGGYRIKITYLAGDDPPQQAVADLVASATARTLLVGPQVATGAISNYSVEGTSISYGTSVASSGSADSLGRFQVGDLNIVGRLKRWVVA